MADLENGQGLGNGSRGLEPGSTALFRSEPHSWNLPVFRGRPVATPCRCRIRIHRGPESRGRLRSALIVFESWLLGLGHRMVPLPALVFELDVLDRNRIGVRIEIGKHLVLG